MNPMHRIASLNEGLLADIRHTDLSLEMVLALYGAIILATAGLWLIGVLAFGRPRTQAPPQSTIVPSDRVTPAAP